LDDICLHKSILIIFILRPYDLIIDTELLVGGVAQN
jgi:hypothetical protein